MADKEIVSKQFDAASISDIGKIDRSTAQEVMLKSGVWPNIVQRPYGVVADPMDTPKSICLEKKNSY